MNKKRIEDMLALTKPSMMTFSDYYSIVNPGKKNHDSGAYSFTVENMNETYHEKDFPKVVRNFYSCGLRFEIREKKIDLHQLNYVKTDLNGDIVRDDSGEAMMMSEEDKKICFPAQFRYENAIVNAGTKELVAFTDDEWGCRLIAVAKEYQGLGLGHAIKMESIKHHPFGHTGGTTMAGENMIYHCYQEMVSKSLRHGEYRKAYLDGKLTMDEIFSILESASVSKKAFERLPEEAQCIIKQYHPGKRKDVVDLDMNKSSEILCHIDSCFAILYSARVFELLKNRDRYEPFIEQGIKGYIYIGGVYHNAHPKLFRMHADDDATKKLLIEIMLNKAVERDEKIRMDKEDVAFCKKHFGDNFTFKKDPSSTMLITELQKPSLTWMREVAFYERKVRLSKDAYDECWHQIQEIANSLGDEAYMKEKKKEAEKDRGMEI